MQNIMTTLTILKTSDDMQYDIDGTRTRNRGGGRNQI
jgi:hypothetical protein